MAIFLHASTACQSTAFVIGKFATLLEKIAGEEHNIQKWIIITFDFYVAKGGVIKSKSGER